MRAAGFVLVGGQSSRMGRDKGRLFAAEIAATVAHITGRVALVGPPERYADLPFECLPDLRPGLGPLAGIESALAAGHGELNLIIGCDMPDLTTDWLEEILEAARVTRARCVVTRDAAGKIHPLCAVYRNDCLPFVRQALDAGKLKLLDLIHALAALEMSTTTVIGNLNTPQQLAAHGERQPLH